MWVWKRRSSAGVALPSATMRIKALRSGDLAARSASIWITGSKVLVAGAAGGGAFGSEGVLGGWGVVEGGCEGEGCGGCEGCEGWD